MISSLNLLYGLYLIQSIPHLTRAEYSKHITAELMLLVVELIAFLYAVDDAVEYLTDQ
jgi:hypothetical protein